MVRSGSGARCATCSRARREQRCWVHKTANVLDALPKRVQPQAKRMLHKIVEAPTRKDASRAIDDFVAEFEAKWPKAAGKLTKDRDQLLAFYDFPAEHWRHLRSTDESVKRWRLGFVRFGVMDRVRSGARRPADRRRTRRLRARTPIWMRFVLVLGVRERRRGATWFAAGDVRSYALAWAWSTPERSAGSGTDACRAACPVEGL